MKQALYFMSSLLVTVWWLLSFWFLFCRLGGFAFVFGGGGEEKRTNFGGKKNMGEAGGEKRICKINCIKIFLKPKIFILLLCFHYVTFKLLYFKTPILKELIFCIVKKSTQHKWT